MCVWCVSWIYTSSFVRTESSAGDSEVPPIVSASHRDAFASDLGPSTLVSRHALAVGLVPRHMQGTIPARTLSGSRAAAEQSDPNLCSFH